MGFYAAKDDAGTVVGCHAARARPPKDAIEISEEDYRALCASKRQERSVSEMEEGGQNVFIGFAEADQQKVENIVAAIVETKVVDHRAELEALRDQLVRSEADRAAMAEKFAEIDALFDAIRQKAADFTVTGDQG